MKRTQLRSRRKEHVPEAGRQDHQEGEVAVSPQNNKVLQASGVAAGCGIWTLWDYDPHQAAGLCQSRAGPCDS